MEGSFLYYSAALRKFSKAVGVPQATLAYPRSPASPRNRPLVLSHGLRAAAASWPLHQAGDKYQRRDFRSQSLGQIHWSVVLCTGRSEKYIFLVAIMVLFLSDKRKPWLCKIHHTAPRPAPKKRQHRRPKETALFPKLSPVPRARKAFLADGEAQLTPHPLALYPNLGEDMPVELLLKVLEVLDPDRKLEDTWAYCQGVRKRKKESAKPLKKHSTQVDLGLPKKTPVSHPGQWLYEEKKPSETDLLHKDGPLCYENVRKGVRNFCNWATTFGSSNIDEEFILKQFDIDYQSKPSHDVLHTIRLNQPPLELKKRVGLKKLQEPQFFQKLDCEQKHQKPQNPHKPKCVKMRYGAWYLNTKLWKKQRADEPLVDPKVSCKAQDDNFKKELQEQEELLADLHGTIAFKDFILSRGYRMPNFLEKMYIRKEHKCECNKTSVK
ncbi:protein FAM47E isoform X2 [Mirounga leonina]|uniref:protein FAM47E isoform X2 n=1 Tax=Mirounga leonina TaxID=9715 RepID=UPI00156C10C1|nr:protein FAM47E isoform X2 [Mirounga leonina]